MKDNSCNWASPSKIEVTIWIGANCGKVPVLVVEQMNNSPIENRYADEEYRSEKCFFCYSIVPELHLLTDTLEFFDQKNDNQLSKQEGS